MSLQKTIDDMVSEHLVDGVSKRWLICNLENRLHSTMDHIKVQTQVLAIVNSDEFQKGTAEYVNKMSKSSAIRHYIVRAAYDVLLYIMERGLLGVNKEKRIGCDCGTLSAVDKCVLSIIGNDPNVVDDYTSDIVSEAVRRIAGSHIIETLPWRI